MTNQAFAPMRAAANCQGFGGRCEIQAEFLREQGERSMENAREVGELIVKFGRDGSVPCAVGQRATPVLI